MTCNQGTTGGWGCWAADCTARCKREHETIGGATGGTTAWRRGVAAASGGVAALRRCGVATRQRPAALRRGGVAARWRGGAVAQWRGGAVARRRGGVAARWRGGAVARWRAHLERCRPHHGALARVEWLLGAVGVGDAEHERLLGEEALV